MNKKDEKKLEQIINLVQNGERINAKTYEETAPHEYLLKKSLNEADKKLFVEFVDFIRKHGYKERFSGATYTYFNIGTHKYFSWRYYSDRITLINRAINPDCK